MNAPSRTRQARRIVALETHSHPVRWDLCLMAMLALLGLLAQPTAR